jgi:hypothetical protein
LRARSGMIAPILQSELRGEILSNFKGAHGE